MADVKRASFSLEDEYQEKLRQIAELNRRSLTQELRVMIDRRAMELGLEPVRSLDPKSPAPSLQMVVIPA